MNILVGDILINKIKDLAFVDKYASVVKIISYSKDGAKKTFPAECRATVEECESGRYGDLVPNTLKKSVLYLEDRGTRFISKRGSVQQYRASYDLVCWLNLPLLGHSGCYYSSSAVVGIINALPATPFNSGNFQRIGITVTGQKPRSINPFQKYSYDEATTQYLMWPYDYFALEIEVDFYIDSKCLAEPTVSAPIQCYPLPDTRYAQIVDQDGNLVKELKSNETYQVIIGSGIDEGGSTQTYSIKVIDAN